MAALADSVCALCKADVSHIAKSIFPLCAITPYAQTPLTAAHLREKAQNHGVIAPSDRTAHWETQIPKPGEQVGAKKQKEGLKNGGRF